MSNHFTKLYCRFLPVAALTATLMTPGTAAPRATQIKTAVKAPSTLPAYRPSSRPHVHVRFMPAPSTSAGSASLGYRGGVSGPIPKTPDTAAGQARSLPRSQALPGGGSLTRLGPSWQSASQGVRVNGKMRVLCVEQGHGSKKHYHDASGTHFVK